MPLYNLLMCKSSSLQDSCTTIVLTSSTMNFMYPQCRLTVSKRYFNKGHTGECDVKWNIEEHQILSKSASNLPDGLRCWTAVSGLPRQLKLKVQHPLQYLYYSSASDVFQSHSDPMQLYIPVETGPGPGIFQQLDAIRNSVVVVSVYIHEASMTGNVRIGAMMNCTYKPGDTPSFWRYLDMHLIKSHLH